jgi:hypothetical protein
MAIALAEACVHPGMEMAAFVESNIEPHILAWN